MYAIVKTGGKQYRVQEGQSLLVERLPVADGDTLELAPLLYVDGADVVDGDELTKVTVQARVLAHERGPKLRIVKFKPKRGYKRRNGHRQELTRIEITSLKLGGRRSKAGAAKAAKEPASEPEAAASAAKPASEPKAAATSRKPASEPKTATKAEATDGA
jgi:large subunit ribosomal protein L21